MKYLYTLLFAFCILTSAIHAQSPNCDGQRYIEPIFNNLIETFDVKYGENISVTGQTVELFVDVFEPEESDVNARPLVLLLHGGAFVTGDKSSMHNICRDFASRGYVAASMSYRLFDGPLIPLPDSLALIEVVVQSVEDAFGAMRFFINDTQTDDIFGINPEMIFIGGVSAGGITSIHAAYMDENDDVPAFMSQHIDPDFGLPGASNEFTDITPEVQGVLNYSGAIYNVSWMDENDEPIFSVHDDQDNVVPYGVGFATPFFGIPIVSLQGSEIVHGKAQELGIPSELTTIENSLGHVSYFNNLSSAIAIEVLDNSSVFLEGIACADVSSTESLSQSGMHIYAAPNPSSAEMQIVIPQEFMGGQLEVFDVSGQVKYAQSIRDLNMSLHASDIGRGLFVVRLSADPAYGAFYSTTKIIFK